MPTTTTGVATSFIDFTRASNATVTDSDGKVKWAPHNLLTNSESFDAASWTKSSVTPTANSIAAPNGTTTADTLAASGANGTTLQTFTAEAISYTFAVWLKRKTGTGNIQIAADSGTYTTVTITSDWTLYTVTQTPAAGSKSAGIRIVTSADEVYAWGASLYRSDLAMQPNTSAYPMYNPTTPKNLLGYTESLTTGWTNSNTTDAIVSEVNPVGLTGAVDVAATAGNGTLLGSLSLLASPYTFSIWLKRKTGGGTVEITVDGTTYVTAAVTGTWTRFSTTLTPSAGTKTPGIRLVTSGDAVYAWGAQLSDSASLDPYVPVYGAAVTSAAYYGPRRDFDGATLACKGLLVEEQRTNLLLYSAQFDNANWVGTTLTVSANTALTTDPSGGSTADALFETTANSQHIKYQAVALAGSNKVFFSIYMKAGTQTYGYVQVSPNGGPRFSALIDLSAGSILATRSLSGPTGTSASITPIGNGWHRVVLSVTNVSGTMYAHVATSNSATPTYDAVDFPTYAGDITKGIYVWGAQLEDNASVATSYIPTGSASATRNADVASVSTQAFPYSASEGTLVAAFNGMVVSGTATNAVVSISDGTTSNRIDSYSDAFYSLYVVSGGSPQANIDAGTVSVNTVTKIGSAFAENNFAAVINGGTVGTDPSGTVPTVNRMYIGAGSTGGQQLNGHIRQITYLPRRISNTELQTRTA